MSLISSGNMSVSICFFRSSEYERFSLFLALPLFFEKIRPRSMKRRAAICCNLAAGLFGYVPVLQRALQPFDFRQLERRIYPLDLVDRAGQLLNSSNAARIWLRGG